MQSSNREHLYSFSNLAAKVANIIDMEYGETAQRSFDGEWHTSVVDAMWEGKENRIKQLRGVIHNAKDMREKMKNMPVGKIVKTMDNIFFQEVSSGTARRLLNDIYLTSIFDQNIRVIPGADTLDLLENIKNSVNLGLFRETGTLDFFSLEHVVDAVLAGRLSVTSSGEES